VVGINGGVYAAGDVEHVFSIMSVSKPFVFALVCRQLGADDVREKLGVNATGLPFNSLEAVERGKDGTTNPMVNPVPSQRPAWYRVRTPAPNGASLPRACHGLRAARFR